MTQSSGGRVGSAASASSGLEQQLADSERGAELQTGAGAAAGVLGEVAGDAGEEVEMIKSTLLYKTLRSFGLIEEVIDGVMAQLQHQLGVERAYNLACEEWFSEWGRWRVFAEQAQGVLVEDAGDTRVAGEINSLMYHVLQRLTISQQDDDALRMATTVTELSLIHI